MFFRQFNLLVQDVILIGCGGTGSRVVAPLVQLLKTAPSAIAPKLWLMDGDIVENKNLSRQNFIQQDIGRNKAEVLAERYGNTMDFPITASSDFVYRDSDIRELLDDSESKIGGQTYLRNTRRVIIMCVDSMEARKNILSSCWNGDIIIDAGNEDSYGHIGVYDSVALDTLDNNIEEDPIAPFTGEFELPFIPLPVSKWEDAIANPPEATGSCADLDQSLAINFMMSAGIINFMQNLVYNNKFYYRTMFFDLHRGNSVERMTPVWLHQEMTNNRIPTDDYRSIHHSTLDHLCSTYDVNNRRAMYSALKEKVADSVTFVPPELLAILK